MNIEKSVPTLTLSDGITMKYQIGRSLGLKASIISDIGIIRTIDDSGFLLRATSSEKDGRIVRALLDTMAESELTKKHLQKIKYNLRTSFIESELFLSVLNDSIRKSWKNWKRTDS